MDDRILAKSAQNGRCVDLREHTEAVVHAARRLFGDDGEPTPLLLSWLAFFGLPVEAALRFQRNLILACIFHDFGKASDGFQRMLRKLGEQVVRHEHISGLMLSVDPLRSWLEAGNGIDREVVIAAVLSHHMKVSPDTIGAIDPRTGLALVGDDVCAVRVRASASEVRACLDLAAPILDTPPDLEDITWTAGAIRRATARFKREAHAFRREILSVRGGERNRFLAAVKAGLVAADSAGSALVRENIDLDEWIDGCFPGTTISAEWIEREILEPRIREIERRKGQPFVWHDFQNEAGHLGPRALLLAGCGAGKTLAAWRWIAAQLERRPASRVIFLYPTRATATEGFRDYVSWAGADAALRSGTSAYDLDGMFDNVNDSRRAGDYHVPERLFALGFWPKRVFSATVDSFLAFMTNQYGSICMLPVLCDSVLVIDEVHSFDTSMFAALDRFLGFFPNVPVLCMTASLPEDRKRVLTSVRNLSLFPSDPKLFEDLVAQADAPRYRLGSVTQDAAAQRVVEALAENKRVLWVVNTVRRCQETARRFFRIRESGDIPDVPILCYHSRLRLSDRKRRHADAVEAFQGVPAAKLLVTTQVCEMSLDLNAEVLVTEVAPVPSLIQRMGRCCRVPIPDDDKLGEILIYAPENARPYRRSDIDRAGDFVASLANRDTPVSQSELSRLLETVQVGDPAASDQYSDFLDAGSYAMSRDNPFRDTDDFTCDCILDGDVAEFLRMRHRNDPQAEGFVIPVPRRFAAEDPRLGRCLKTAPSSRYTPELGFLESED